MWRTVVMNSTICPPLGHSIPQSLPHAISVSLPTWKDNVGYEEGDRRVLDAMRSGYPRFWIHPSIRKLASICDSKFGLQNEQCLLFPTATVANHCREFMIARWPKIEPPPVRLAQFQIHSNESTVDTDAAVALHIVLFPGEAFPTAKEFWQHTGLGISSRMADRCLALLYVEKGSSTDAGGMRVTSPSRTSFPVRNKHYAAKAISTGAVHIASPQGVTDSASHNGNEELCIDQATYLEERYGRNMPLNAVNLAKRTLRRRIAGVLVHNASPSTGNEELRPSTRGVESVTENDVYLFPTGMSAIWSAHQLCLNTLPPSKSICFGFPYTDTLKILQKWGTGCHFFGAGSDADIDALASLLESPGAQPILALFCEFPSNPLLRSANLLRLRRLADTFGFIIVVDDTLGNFINVEILPYADIVVSSLTKVFSGETNVMGGSLVLNPKSRYFSSLKTKMAELYEDIFWGEDAIFMERNSRDFVKRIHIINRNTEAVCDFLHGQTAAERPVVKAVYYPKWVTRSNYDRCRLPPLRGPDGHEEGNFGGLFSITFTSNAASEAFYDALPCAKGPSLGTNFTLACPYTILAHYAELSWAAENGVEEGLVRVSVGLEDQSLLLKWFAESLRKAEETMSKL